MAVVVLAVGLLVAEGPALAVQIDATASNFSPGEKRIIDAAVAIWEAALPSPDRFAADLRKASLERGTLGVAADFSATAEGVPSAASIVIADDVAWYVDPAPDDAAEFRQGRTPAHFVSDLGAPAFGHFDLLTVVLHELGHAVGISTSYSRFADHVEPGAGTERTYVGATFTAGLTPEALGTHVDPAFLQPDLMNPVLASGERLLPDRLDLLLLADAFAYAVVLPPAAVPQPPTVVAMLVAIAAGALRARRRRMCGGGARGDDGGLRRELVQDSEGLRPARPPCLQATLRRPLSP